MVNGDPDRISFVNWGAHQGTNSFADISNVILAGTLFMPEWRYEGLAHLCANLPMDVELPETLVGKVKAGEHMNLILQALCRASVRRSIGDQCAPCNAYIIAAKKSGIRTLLPMIFPGCKLGTWRPVGRKLKGKVADAVAHVRHCFEENSDGSLLLLDLRKALGMSDISNFNKTIRRHSDFVAVLEEMQVEEVVTGKGLYPNALAKKTSVFGSVDGSSYIAIVND